MKTRTRIIAGLLVAGVMSAPAAAQFAGVGPLIVNDPTALIRLIQQVNNQVTSLENEARNLAKLPPLNFGNIQGEVQSVSAQANGLPAQIRGIVASTQILQNAPTDVARTEAINASATGAQGVVGQQQATNAHLSNLENIGLQGNAAAGARDQADFANKSDFAGGLIQLTGNDPSSVPNTTRPM